MDVTTAADALKSIWTTDPVEFVGKYYALPKSHIYPKPVQKPHPPPVIALVIAVPTSARDAQRYNYPNSARAFDASSVGRFNSP